MKNINSVPGANVFLPNISNESSRVPVWQSIATTKALIWVATALFIGSLLLLSCFSRKISKESRKAQQAKRMREVYISLEKQSNTSSKTRINLDQTKNSVMQISELWVYPIKSLRGCLISKALLTKEGFYLDRRFMLLKDHGGLPRKLENMAISSFPAMCLFHTTISGEKLIIQYRSPGAHQIQATDDLEIPLSPSPDEIESLEQVEIEMHNSPTIGYNMGDRYNAWFSKRFGFPVILVFWGGNPRAVLGNLPDKPTNQGLEPQNLITKILNSFPITRSVLETEKETIAFNDCAPFLVISDASVADVTARLPEGVEMDLSKFRANIVLTGHSITPYEEDFWGELSFNSSVNHGHSNASKILLTGNCGRCTSLNVDYVSGKSGTGRDGKVLQLLQKDRRVDPGMKYSPIFGRYGFIDKRGEGKILSVGDEVVVSRKNEERTRFYWPGIST